VSPARSKHLGGGRSISVRYGPFLASDRGSRTHPPTRPGANRLELPALDQRGGTIFTLTALLTARLAILLASGPPRLVGAPESPRLTCAAQFGG
jgi:hypothetical protein